MSKITILITGGSGFIGTNLVNHLNKMNYFIINLDKAGYASTKEKFKEIQFKKKYKFQKFNLNNKKKLLKLLSKYKPKFIIHLAAESHVDRSIDTPSNFIIENISGTTNLYNCIFLTKRKNNYNPNIIHISTDEVYGSVPYGCSKETDILRPNSPYSASKASSDHIARAFGKTFGLNICILRLCNNYGPYQFPEKLIPTIVYKMIENKKIPIYGKGKNIREWMFVKDTSVAIEKIVKNFKNNNIYNISSNISLSNIDIVKKIIQIFKKKNFKKYIKYVKDRPGHDYKYSLNTKKFNKKFRMKYSSLNRGLKETIKWYLNNPRWFASTKKRYGGQRIGKI